MIVLFMSLLLLTMDPEIVSASNETTFSNETNPVTSTLTDGSSISGNEYNGITITNNSGNTGASPTSPRCKDEYLFYLYLMGSGMGAMILCNMLCFICYMRSRSNLKRTPREVSSNASDSSLSAILGRVESPKTKSPNTPTTVPKKACPVGTSMPADRMPDPDGDCKEQNIGVSVGMTEHMDITLPMIGGNGGVDIIEQQREARQKDRSIYGVPSFKSLNIEAPTESGRIRAEQKRLEWEEERRKFPNKKTPPKHEKETDSLYGVPDLPRESVYLDGN